MDKQQILDEMRRTAEANGGKPLGKDRFEAATSITDRDWLRFWSRYGDIQREAGYEPNQLQGAYDETYLIEKFIELIRETKAYPTVNDRRRKAYNDKSFPSHTVFDRIGNKSQLITLLHKYCQDKPDYADVLEIIEPHVVHSSIDQDPDADGGRYGFVYLVRGHPGEYKIGRTNLVDRRLSELGATASIEQSLIHEIKTDDPSGIEAYWHRRFQDKRMRGEWYKLSANDVKLFKRWRRIY